MQHPQRIDFGLQHLGHRSRGLLEEGRRRLADRAGAVVDVGDAAVRGSEAFYRCTQGGLVAQVAPEERDRSALTSEPVDDPLTLGIELPPSRQQQGAKAATHQIAGEREANLAGAPGDERHAVPLVFRLRQARGGLLHHPRHSPAADVSQFAWSIMLIELARDRGRDAFRREAGRREIHRLASASPVLGPEALVESGLLRACKSCGRRPARPGAEGPVSPGERPGARPS